MTYVQTRKERAEDAVKDATRSAGQRVVDVIEMRMVVSEDGGFGEVGACTSAWTRAG